MKVQKHFIYAAIQFLVDDIVFFTTVLAYA